MTIDYKELNISMYPQLEAGWKLLPDNATGLGDDKKSIEVYLLRNPRCSIAAFHENELIGAVLAGHNGRRAILNHLFVLPEFRRKGVARELVTRCFDELRNQGITRAAIFIHKTNTAAQEFWKVLGFEKVDFIETYGCNL